MNIEETKSKRIRKHNAKELPNGIRQNMLNKYVVYYREWVDKEHTKQREYFKIEGHPKLEKIWIGNKSNKFSVLEKLKQANSFADDLYNKTDNNPDNEEVNIHDNQTNNNTITLPKYVSLIFSRNKQYLYYDRKVHNETRISVKMVLPEKYDLQEQICILNEKVNCKYNYYNNTNSSSNEDE
jgi:hypothetical protein